MKLHRTLFTAWVFAAGVALHAQNAHNMVVQTNKLGAEIQPTMYGLFFEDINYGAVHSNSRNVLWGGMFSVT